MPVLTPVQLFKLAKEEGDWNYSQSLIATAIALAESGGRTDAINDKNADGSIDRGPWQINSVHGYNPALLLAPDGKYNARAAREVYDKQGWSAWTVWNSPEYKKQLAKVSSTIGKDPFIERQIGREPPNTGAIGDTVEDVADAVEDPLSSVGDALGKLTEKNTWKSVGLVILGGVMATAGVLILAGEFMKKMPTPIKGVIK